MTRDAIIRMAREAGVSNANAVWLGYAEELERFAHLVAAAEREAIARWYEDRGWMLDDGLVPDAIRERSAS